MVSKINLITILIVWLFSNVSLGQSLTWEYIPKNSSLGACVSSSKCDSLTFCYGLKYTPSVSGKITSYTLGFQGNCPGGATPYLPVLSGSCIMVDNTDFINGCGTPTNKFLLQASGNSGNYSVFQGQPIYIHQICFKVNTTDTLIIQEDSITQLTLSIDSLVNNQPITQFLTFSPFEINYNVCYSPLPVTWSTFEAQQNNHEVELNWATASELNNDFFSIEWSTDGKHFYKIGQVSSKGNSSRPIDYMFLHQNPQSGINYYKIRQTDYDGKYDYSRTVKVLINKSDSNASFVIHPNPTGSELNILIKENYSNENITMEWFNPKGQLIKTIILDQNVSHSIDVTDLAAGPYFLMMKHNQNMEVIKFIKL